MSEDTLTLQGVLSSLEGLNSTSDCALYTDKHNINLLKNLTIILKRDELTATEADADRVLRVCSTYSTDLKCIPFVLSIIDLLVSKEIPNVDYQKTALIVLEILRLKCIERDAKNIRTLAFRILLSHSTTTLNLLVYNNCPVLIETFGVYLRLSPLIPHVLGIQIEAFVLLELLKILQPLELTIFVKEGIPLWLSGVVPTTITYLTTTDDNEEARSILRLVELLADEMIKQDYFNYSEWPAFLLTVVDPKQIPASISALMKSGKETWHIIWVVIVKLLKTHVTRNYGKFGSPINSMLPVVEKAFKMESEQRIRSFLCWNELIENFSNETNPNCIVKRIKLLVVPLRLNNAKTEEAAQVKFQTWWFLIRKFKHRLDTFSNEVIVPFLQFMFGKENYLKPIVWIGQLSNLKNCCLEAFAEIVGHDHQECQCNIAIPRLGGKIISTRLYIEHWKNWLWALRTVIRLVSEDDVEDLRSCLRCIWMSFVVLTADLPDNSVRRDLFTGLINVLVTFLQNDHMPRLLAVVVEVLVVPLFKNNRVKTLLTSRSEEHRPMHQVVKTIMVKSFDDYYERQSSQELKINFDPIVRMIINESVTTPAYMILLLDELPQTDSSMKFWTVLAQAASNTDVCLQAFNAILRWPLKAVHHCTEVKEAAFAWYTLYSIVHIKLENIGFDKEITKILMKIAEENKASVYFVLTALIGVLKHRLDQDKIEKLDVLTKKIVSWEYKEKEQLLPSLVDALVLMIENASTNMDKALAQSIINCVRNVFIILKSDPECSENVSSPTKTSVSLVRENMQHNTSIKKTVLSDTLVSAMKTFLFKCSSDSIKNVIRETISFLEIPLKTDVVPKKFASPKIQNVKKEKKKQKIVDTVLVNGEDYVVVKCNWKFNPENLTENQKEKLQKKRDNIPALYQDLSQSQDEIKLSSWKTDSHDTSLSSSKSACSNNASEILKNIPCTDVVPKIMENFHDKNIQQNASATSSPVHGSLPIGPVSPARVASPVPSTTPASTVLAAPDPLPTFVTSTARIESQMPLKSPARITSPAQKDTSRELNQVISPKGGKFTRMSLKDRISRSVKNLIEKSSASPQIIDQDCQVPIILENIVVPPVWNETTNNIISDKNENLTGNVSEMKRNDKMILIAKQNDRMSLSKVDECTPATINISQKDLNITKSAPLPFTDRPSRVKRKPKKYNDSLLLGFKKTRHSIFEALSDSQNSQDDLNVTEALKHISKNEIKKPETENTAIEKIKISNHSKHSQLAEPEIQSPVVQMTNNEGIVHENEKIESNYDTKAKNQLKDSKLVQGTGISHSPVKGETYLEARIVLSPTTTFVTENIEKPPEKHTAVKEGEIPCNTNKVSESCLKEPNVIVEKLPVETTPFYLVKETDFKTSKHQDNYMKSRKTKALLEKSSKLNKSSTAETSETEESNKEDIVTASSKNEIKDNKSKDVLDQRKIKKSDTPRKTNKKESEIVTVDINETPDIDKNKRKENDKKQILTVSPNIQIKESTSKDLSNQPKTKKRKTHETNSEIATIDTNQILQQLSESNNKDIELTTPTNKINDDVSNHDADQQKAKKNRASGKTAKNNSEIVSVNVDKTQKRLSISSKDKYIESHKKAATPKSKNKDATQTTTTKKTLRENEQPMIEKRLRIDTVEGHPLLYNRSEKRLTRKQILEAENNRNNRRKTLKNSLDKSKSEATPKTVKKAKENTSPPSNITVKDTQERNDISNVTLDDPACSEDIIESSQETTMTTISLKPKSSQKRLVVALELINFNVAENTQDLIQDTEINDVTENKNHEISDIELSQNKTTEVSKNTIVLTENMDTEPIESSGDVEFLNCAQSLPAQTPKLFSKKPKIEKLTEDNNQYQCMDYKFQVYKRPPLNNEAIAKVELTDSDIITQSLPETPFAETGEVSSPFQDEDQRKQDFLNNTVQISPIKVQSPEKEKMSQSPETSSEFVIVRLSTPVHSDGEPYEKHGSPEFFSEDRGSPDKRDASPPRSEAAVPSASPNSSLSLKKNRPQVRPNGRAAHMLGLCVNDDTAKKLSTIIVPEEVKKTSTPAKRNLRIIYHSEGDNSKSCDQSDPENNDPEIFLKLNRELPTLTSTPSGPILKRKLADIADETPTLPASKRKRVSFHDPPVSTTISVHKYIDTLCASPQSSKKREKLTRSTAKSPKRLENAFNLDTVLSNAVESFAVSSTPTDDTQNISLDITPTVEVIKTSELNDTNPICPELVNCDEPIDAISLELSSPAMRELLVKELEGKIKTIGDLAKMTELEVNRLCIKAPKIQVAKKVLAEYAVKRPCAVETVIEEAFSEPLTETLLANETASIEAQTIEVDLCTEMLVDAATSASVPTDLASTQTDDVATTHTSAQTDESGGRTTADIISTCFSEREDFVQTLAEKLDVNSKMTIINSLPSKTITDSLLERDDSNPTEVLDRLLEGQSKSVPENEKANMEVSFLSNYLCRRYADADVTSLCIQMLQKKGTR